MPVMTKVTTVPTMPAIWDEAPLLKGPLLNRLGASLDHLGRLQELRLLAQGGQRAGPNRLVGARVQLPGPRQVMAAGSQKLPVQALQTGKEDQHPQQEQAKEQQQAKRVGPGRPRARPGRAGPAGCAG
jgi:hypothetical protein